MSTTEAPVLEPALIRRLLEAVADPEIPAVSIVDLGMVGEIEVQPDVVRVEILPTFVGCPAQELIRAAVEEQLSGLGRAVSVDLSFATPWSSDRITPRGREALRRSGFAPPPPVRPNRGLPMLEPVADPAAAAVPCPYCGSLRTTLQNAFGPTLCRSIRHCADCRQPFEAFKPL